MLKLMLHVSHIILKHFEFHQAGERLVKVQDLFGILVRKSRAGDPHVLWFVAENEEEYFELLNTPNLATLVLQLDLNRIILQILILHLNFNPFVGVDVGLDSCDFGKVFLVSAHFVFFFLSNVSGSCAPRPKIHTFVTIRRQRNIGRMTITALVVLVSAVVGAELISLGHSVYLTELVHKNFINIRNTL